MYEVPFDMVSDNMEKLQAASKKLKPPPVDFYPYLKRVLTERFEELKPEFPQTIKIAKDYAHLMAHDLEPAQVITLTEPITMEDGTPMWFESACKEAYFRPGFDNMDARHIAKTHFDNEYIHMFLGGASGQGKSVTLNALLGGMLYEYAPWELEIHMSDAKITEFKKYGIGPHIPHISTIAATEDADFVLSVLHKADDEMHMRSKAFGSLSVSNLKEFHKKTGLVLPRVIIVMDEVESTFKTAGRRAQELSDLIDSFARLGRSAGYHLLMATQNMSSDIPKSAVGQIRIRACLGSNEATSEAVLSNKGAMYNYGRVGRLILNTEVMNGGDTKRHNVTYQTPYLKDEDFPKEMLFLHNKGVEVGFERHLDFYDEEARTTVAEFENVIDSSFKKERPSVDTVFLGYPAFVLDEPDGILKIRLDHRDIENILICSTAQERFGPHLANLSSALSRQGYTQMLMTPIVEDFQEWIKGAKNVVEARTSLSGPIPSILGLVKKRLMLLTIDSMLDGVKAYSREDIEKMLEADGVPRDRWGNDMFYRRVVVYQKFKSDPELSKEWAAGLSAVPNTKVLISEYDKYQSGTRKVTKDDFGKAVFYIGDLSKILGLGREPKSKPVEQLKLAMQDASRANVLLVLFTRTLEGITELKSGVRFTIFDVPDTRDWGRIGADEPRDMPAILACLYDSLTKDKLYKFKRTVLTKL